jgi:hypothetical protein
MKQIILHIGDRVHHKTLGDGVVIAVNEDYCTARFGEKEANFRIPDAFVRGFLKSEDAKFGAEEGEQSVEEILPGVEKKPEEKKGTGCAMAVLISMVVFTLTPFMVYYFWHFGKTGDIADLVGAICFIIGIILLIPFAIKLAKVSGMEGLYKSKTNHNPSTDIMAGMMGAEMLGRAAKRERQAAEKRRYDSLYWQESIRDKNPRHDFDYDKMDD